MANTREGNAIRIDTTALFDENFRIKGIKYIGAAASSAVVRGEDASGGIMWEENASTNVFDNVEIQNNRGVHVTITGTAILYLYT